MIYLSQPHLIAIQRALIISALERQSRNYGRSVSSIDFSHYRLQPKLNPGNAALDWLGLTFIPVQMILPPLFS